MTGPPGPVIPGQHRGRRGVSPASAGRTVTPRALGGQRGTVRTMADADREKLARRIYDAAHLTGTFTLRSGVTSNEYFDKYRFEADPGLLADIAEAMAPLVPAGCDVLAGLELGGVPARDDAVAGDRAAGAFRPQGGEDLRHVPARRRRRHRRHGDCASSRTS